MLWQKPKGGTNRNHIKTKILKNKKLKSEIKSNVIFEESDSGTQQPVADHKPPTHDPFSSSSLLDASVDSRWLREPARPKSHTDAVESARRRLLHEAGKHPQSNRRELREHRAVFAPPVPVLDPNSVMEWPMDSYEKPPFEPPWPSAENRERMRVESSSRHPETPLGPLAQEWVDDLQAWYRRLQRHFGFDPTDLPANLRRNVDKWRKRLAFLKESHPGLHDLIISNIVGGHKIPFERIPNKFFRSRNPPSLAADAQRAWAAIQKDLNHGALEPVNIQRDGVPRCVCPVRTADKNDGSARFVHNSRRVNKCIPRDEVTCQLESLLRARNMFIPDGFLIGSDYASGYHCISMDPDDSKYLAFALHIDEIPAEAVAWLHAHHPKSFLPKRKCFVFKYKALPFGLASSCRTFNDLVSALMGAWRRWPIDGQPTRVSSYIDDVLGATGSFDSVSLTNRLRISYTVADTIIVYRRQ